MARNKQEPTFRQIQVLQCIYAHMRKHHICPTIRELMEVTGMSSTSVVNYQLLRLERLGCIVRNTRMSRSMTLTERAFQYLNVEETTVQVATVPIHLLDELHRLQSENARLRNLKVNHSIAEQLRTQREYLENKHKLQVEALERERDRLIDQLVRVQMRAVS